MAHQHDHLAIASTSTDPLRMQQKMARRTQALEQAIVSPEAFKKFLSGNPVDGDKKPITLGQVKQALFDEDEQNSPFAQWYVENFIELNGNNLADDYELKDYRLFLKNSYEMTGHSDPTVADLTFARNNYLIEQSKQLDLPEIIKEKLENRLLTGNYQVNGESILDSNNLLALNDLNIESEPAAQQAYAVRAKQATKVLDEYKDAPDAVKKVVLQSLADTGTLPNLIEKESDDQKTVLRTHRVQAKALGNGITDYQIKEKNWTLVPDANGNLIVDSVEQVPVTQPGDGVQLKDPASYRNEPLPTEPADLERLAQTLQTPDNQKALETLTQQLPDAFEKQDWSLIEGPIKELTHQIATAYQIDEPAVEFKTFDNPAEQGWTAGYDLSRRVISINTSTLNRIYKETLENGTNPQQVAVEMAMNLSDTLAHELRHTHQQQAKENPAKFGLTKQTPRLADYQDNHGYYTSPVLSTALTGDLGAYYLQPVEWDAFQAGRVATKTLEQQLASQLPDKRVQYVDPIETYPSPTGFVA